MKIRRVVTGHTPDGKATVASDSDVDAITIRMLPGAEFYRLWDRTELLASVSQDVGFVATDRQALESCLAGLNQLGVYDRPGRVAATGTGAFCG